MNISKINLGRKGVSAIVSELEADILAILWKEKEADSKTVFEKLGKKHSIAHSTVSVYLDRLHSKGFVGRKVESGKGGLHYLYRPRLSEEEISHKVVDGFVSFLKNNFGERSTAYLRKRLK